MPQPARAAGVAEVVAAIGIAVVGHDPLDADAVAREPGERPREEGNRAGLALVGQDLGVGQARGVIDGDVQVFPADAVVAVDHAGAAAGDAVPGTGDLAELLGIDVHDLAGTLALVAHDRRGRIEPLEAAEAEAAQDAPTVESGRPRRRAITGEVSLCRRSASITATCSDGSRRWRAGAELRSLSASAPPARHRASHLRTVRSLTPKSAATLVAGCF